MDARATIAEKTGTAAFGGAGARMLDVLTRTWSAIGLPGKLLLLTASFVLIAESFIFLPSVATYRVSWLTERLTAAQLAALASGAFPDGQVPSALRASLLRTAQVKLIASRSGGVRRLILAPESDMSVDSHYDLRSDPQSFSETLAIKLAQVRDAAAVLLSRDGRVIRVTGQSGDDTDDMIEIVMPEAPLKAAMVTYASHIFLLSVIISALTAVLVYFALNRLLVRPLKRITQNMLNFSADPEDSARQMIPSGRLDEIGVAERELSQMQGELAGLLTQKNRLAQLGLAVSKINHDLRNLLANTQLISDRLVDIPDPTVQRFVPKLIVSLDRAISFCNSSLQFGRAAEAAPHRELILLKPLVEEVADTQGLQPDGPIAFFADMDDSLRIDADRDQLFRGLSNLVRNAMQAIESVEGTGRGEIHVVAHREGRKVVLDVTDTGPGVPPKARDHLFKAFQSSTKKGGTGLGLVIAAELVQAHGGRLTFVDDGPGAHFRIELPDRPAH